jgi:biopolymer transport protein ExbB
MIALFLMFFALYLYFERLMAINAASHIDSNFMSQIRDNIRNGRIDNAKIALHT